ncbi:MAG: serine hydrolase [Proteobacteria bacterium]|nr:serine hydrolase [Pseudomonadota bacterium]
MKSSVNNCLLSMVLIAASLTSARLAAEESNSTQRIEEIVAPLVSAHEFSGAIVHWLAFEGDVQLDEPVTRYLPEFPHAQTTVRRLISHSNGSRQRCL